MQTAKHTKSKQGKRKRSKQKKKGVVKTEVTTTYLQQKLTDNLNSVDATQLVEVDGLVRKTRHEVKKGLKRFEKMQDSEDELEETMQRTSVDSSNTFEIDSSILFEPYRAMGYITSSTPFFVHRNDDQRLMTVSIDHAFHVYDLEKLKLVYISKPVKQKILQIQTHKSFVYTLLSNNSIVKWHRMNIEASYASFGSSIIQFLVIATYIMVLCENGKLYIVEHESGNIKTIIDIGIKGYMFMHPVSYLNKVIIAGEGDQMIIFNIEAKETIYKFKNITQKLNGAKILVIEQSPLVDIVGLGLESGDIHIVNLKQDKVLTSFSQDSPVKSLSFSSDTSLERSLLASCTTDGNILFWDLNERKIHSVIQKAHNSKTIDKIEFLNNEPIVLSSSGDDNSIKMWLFDMEHGSNVAPRLLKERGGHSDTPHKIEFYGSEGTSIVSSSENTFLRYNSLINEHISHNFESKKNLNKKKISELGEDIGKTIDFS